MLLLGAKAEEVHVVQPKPKRAAPAAAAGDSSDPSPEAKKAAVVVEEAQMAVVAGSANADGGAQATEHVTAEAKDDGEEQGAKRTKEA